MEIGDHRSDAGRPQWPLLNSLGFRKSNLFPMRARLVKDEGHVSSKTRGTSRQRRGARLVKDEGHVSSKTRGTSRQRRGARLVKDEGHVSSKTRGTSRQRRGARLVKDEGTSRQRRGARLVKDEGTSRQRRGDVSSKRLRCRGSPSMIRSPANALVRSKLLSSAFCVRSFLQSINRSTEDFYSRLTQVEVRI